MFEVDGEVVRDRKERIAALWLTGSTEEALELQQPCPAARLAVKAAKAG